MPAILARVKYEQPALEKGWQRTTRDEFPWHPKAFIEGWTKAVGGQKAGIFLAFQRPSYEVPYESLFKNLSSSLAEEYDVLGDEEFAVFEMGKYGAAQMTFFSKHGNGLFFGEAEVPTRVMFIYVRLERQPDSEVWPLLLFFFAAPDEDFKGLDREFLDFVGGVLIVPPGVEGGVVEVESKKSGTDSIELHSVPVVRSGSQSPPEGKSSGVSRDNPLLSGLPLELPAEGMTYEEYRDAHRQAKAALMLASVALPGTLHLYAGEHKKAWLNAGLAGGGGGLGWSAGD